MSSRINIGNSQEFVLGQMKYWDQVKESGGFDVEHISAPQGTCGLMPYDCENERIRYPDRVLVNLYARLGLHRYNLSNGTNLELHHLKKFNKTMNYISSYRITLVVYDPATTSLVTFLVGVSEQAYGRLNLMVFVARPQADRPHVQQVVRPIGFTNDPFKPDACDANGFPFWPTDFDDTKRFHLLKESELQGNNWIPLYLELALCSNDRNIPESHVSQLKIVRVAMETFEDVDVINANFYITFKGLPVARVGEDGEHVERKVIIRRYVDFSTGYLILMGGFGFSVGEDTSERNMTRSRTLEEAYAAFDAEQRLRPTTLPCPVIHISDYWKNLDKNLGAQ
ncbi:hypothetical protein N665_1554s0010 [Sinapis alba]|nr:hypothetical protein N665_1554s0010 [Sinapis alba]